MCSQEAQRIRRMDDKLNSLQLNGLVDFNMQHAKYIHPLIVIPTGVQVIKCMTPLQ